MNDARRQHEVMVRLNDTELARLDEHRRPASHAPVYVRSLLREPPTDKGHRRPARGPGPAVGAGPRRQGRGRGRARAGAEGLLGSCVEIRPPDQSLLDLVHTMPYSIPTHETPPCGLPRR